MEGVCVGCLNLGLRLFSYSSGKYVGRQVQQASLAVPSLEPSYKRVVWHFKAITHPVFVVNEKNVFSAFKGRSSHLWGEFARSDWR
jgi:hypothetical protein